MARKKAARSKVAPVADESAEIGKTSQEIAPSSPSTEDQGAKDRSKKKGGLLAEFSIYDALLLTALVCITLATLRVFFAMKDYGGYFWDKPWNP